MKINKNIIILLLAAALSIALVFILTRKYEKQVSNEVEYTKLINELDEVISTLQGDIALYQKEIEEANKELEELKNQLNYARKNYKETDADIVNGNADYNFRFLSDFLSEDDN